MLTGPPAGGAPSPTLGAGGVQGPRPLAYGLPTSVASFRARETKDEVPSHAVPQIQAFPGLSRPFQAFPEPECPLVLPFAPLTPGTMFFANRPGLGVHGPWSPCFPGLTPTRGPWGRDRPWIEAQRPAQGRALSRESGAPRPPPRAQLGHRPRSPACPRAALELEVTEGPEDSSAQTPAGTGASLSGGHGLQLNGKPGAVCPGRRRRRERGIGGSSSTHARRPGPDICLF